MSQVSTKSGDDTVVWRLEIPKRSGVFDIGGLVVAEMLLDMIIRQQLRPDFTRALAMRADDHADLPGEAGFLQQHADHAFRQIHVRYGDVAVAHMRHVLGNRNDRLELQKNFGGLRVVALVLRPAAVFHQLVIDIVERVGSVGYALLGGAPVGGKSGVLRQRLDAGEDDLRIDAIARDQCVEHVEAAHRTPRDRLRQQRAIHENQIDLGASEQDVAARLQ